jgi:hypothetical protein
MHSRTDLKITVILGLLAVIVFALIPQSWIFGGQIICPTRWLFHFPCPLCGMTRAAWLLVHLQWKEAWMYNPGIFPLMVLFFIMIVAAIKGEKWLKIMRWSVWGCMGLILIFYFLRLI